MLRGIPYRFRRVKSSDELLQGTRRRGSVESVAKPLVDIYNKNVSLRQDCTVSGPVIQHSGSSISTRVQIRRKVVMIVPSV